MLGCTWFCPFPVPKISPCMRRFIPHLSRESKIVIHARPKYEKVSHSFESLDYQIIEDEITYIAKLRYGETLSFRLNIERNVVTILVGVACGICGSLVEVIVHHVLQRKVDFLRTRLDGYDGSSETITILYLYWYMFTVIPAMIGSAIVVLIEPGAIGGGIPGVIGFLNGIAVPGIVSMKVLILKLCSLLWVLTGDLPVGKEGPLIHAGVILGANMPMLRLPFTHFKFFRLLQNDREIRDMASAGIAAGLTSAFFAPIGGVILALEESLTYCTIHLTSRILLCALMTACFSFLLLSAIINHCWGCIKSEEFRFLQVRKSVMQYSLFEMPMFILVGILGGIFGSFWNYLEMQMSYFRSKFPKRKLIKLIDTFVLASVVASFTFILLVSIKECRGSSSHNEHEKTDKIPPMHCPEGTVPTISLFFLFDASEKMNTILSFENPIGLRPLLLFILYYFIMSALSMGGNYSAGIFMPNLYLGGLWGRALAELVLYIHPPAKSWCYPQKYAFLGAGAQLCGTTRICFSLGILMFESSGVLASVIPIFTMLITTKFISEMFTHPIYLAECLMKGMPLLQKTPPAFISWMFVDHIMNTDVVVFPRVTTVSQIFNTLKTNMHNGFPVIEPSLTSPLSVSAQRTYGLLLGLILRSTLLVILKHKLYRLDPFDKICLNTLLHEFRREIKIADIVIPPEDAARRVSLAPYMNRSPFFVEMGTSLTTAYNFFSSLALRHLIVVNNSNEVVGVVTRKDIAIFRTDYTCCTVETKRIPFEPRPDPAPPID